MPGFLDASVEIEVDTEVHYYTKINYRKNRNEDSLGDSILNNIYGQGLEVVF